ncbi:ATP-binding cassette domain-containing protein (plasmid) [Sinorhizobium meliloti]|nr:ATP-binding cassette domain-containing protein [Sinorhizobium meliloti]
MDILKEVSPHGRDGRVPRHHRPERSGKTSLMSLISGIRKPKKGSANWNGSPIGTLGRRTVRAKARSGRAAGRHRREDHRAPGGRARPHALISGRFRPGSPVGRCDRRGGARKRGYGHLADRLWHTLSGGERKRLHIARALAQQSRSCFSTSRPTIFDIGHSDQPARPSFAARP